MNRRQIRTLERILERPERADIKWSEIESLLTALGAEFEEREGSRLAVYLNGRVAIFHRPHPRKETDKGAVKSVRNFLLNAGVKP